MPIRKPEIAGDLAELTAELHQQHRPANPTERFLVDTLIHNQWRLRRLRRAEADLWQHAPGEALERLQRIVNSCERSYHRALKELQRLQKKPRPIVPFDASFQSILKQ
jgi:hypothetical protein